VLRPARRHILPLCLGFLFVNAATACGASLRLVPGGADRGDCKAAPCGSFRYAYDHSEDGDVIEVAAGVYPPQTVPSGQKEVTFQGARGATVRQLHNWGSNVTFDHIDVDAGGVKTENGAALELHSEGRNVRFANSRVGNVLNEKGAMIGGTDSTPSTNLVIDNVEFHDVLVQGEDIHNECIMAHAPGITIRNSTFTNCHTMDISLGRGDWWGQSPYGNVTLENNVFGHSINGDGWHYYGLAWFVGRVENIRVVNNTFENQVRMEDQHIGPGPYSGVWANNIGGGWQCLPGVTYSGNVGKRCDGSDRAVNPSSSCGPPACQSLRTMPVGWVDPANHDFHLRQGSPAVDAGSAEFATRHDRDGVERDGRPDAGAYELQGGSTRAVPPRPARPRLRAVRLTPGTICRRARRGCAVRARLSVRVSRAARVRVRVLRARGARAPRRVRTLDLPARRRQVQVLRARTLRRGVYVLRIVAIDAAGRRSVSATRRLRVR
jgi:hypothetical protein